MKRKKRLEKGVRSIEDQIERHKKKLEQADDETLAEYYKKDIERLERQKRRKEGKL